MFSEGKSPTDVAIALDMREHEVTQLYKESWTLKQLYELNSIYLETKGDLGSFVTLYKLSKADWFECGSCNKDSQISRW